MIYRFSCGDLAKCCHMCVESLCQGETYYKQRLTKTNFITNLRKDKQIYSNMLYNFQRKKLCRHLLVGGALCVAGLAVYSCSDKYDLDEDQPSGLNTIYGYMKEQGNFKTYLKLIDDLGEKEVLSKTGSKTMFIANDEAFKEFFKSNKWGVKDYSELSQTQKKLLLYTAMIDNPYSSSMLSTAEGPVPGEVCRRPSSTTLYDTVTVVPTDNPGGILPNNELFNDLRTASEGNDIVLFTDASVPAPMIHFTGRFLKGNKLESSDVDFLYNQEPGTRKSDDVYVNESKVIKSDIFCKNGFIHQVDKVIMPLDNMAEVIRQHPTTQIYSSILERFAAPNYEESLTKAYNNSQGKDYEAVYSKRYFSKWSADGKPFTVATDKAGNTRNIGADVTLKFDPGWNAYFPNMYNARDGMMEDMAVMLVPSDDAINKWFNGGNGQIVKDYYETIENTPTDVLRQLVNANQFISFVQAVPSQFSRMLDDAGEDLKIKREDVDSVFLACNGLVYKTNKVFSPASYRSVYFPAVIDKSRFSMMASAIESLNYEAYLNSMVSKYAFLIPTNTGMASFLDPVSFGQATGPQMWEFYYEPSEKEGAAGPVKAHVYNCEYVEGQGWQKVGDPVVEINEKNDMQYIPFTASGSAVDKTVLRDRLEYILDNAIVIEEYTPGKKFYKTKSNNYVKIEPAGGEAVEVSGGLQYSDKTPLLSQGNPYKMENGTTYVLDGVVAGTDQSVAKTLAQYAKAEGDKKEFSKFFYILENCGAFTTSVARDKWQAGDQVYGNLTNVKAKDVVGNEENDKSKYAYLLDNYHYTIYAPTDAAMEEAFAMGLPSQEDFEEAERLDEIREQEDENYLYTKVDSIKEVWLDFVKYHIQTNSVFIDQGFKSMEYESGKTEIIQAVDVQENVSEENLVKDENTGKFISVLVKGVEYAIKSGTQPSKDENGTYTVEYYTGKYSPGTPYRLNVDVSSSALSVKDNRGNTAHVLTDKGLYNMMVTEFWLDSETEVTAPSKVKLANYSFAVIHAVDHPLIYSPKSEDVIVDGKSIPSQFIYVRRNLADTTSAKRR